MVLLTQGVLKYDLLHKKELTGMDNWVGQQANQQRTRQIIVVGPCPTISKNGLTHCLITFQNLYLSLILQNSLVGVHGKDCTIYKFAEASL